MQETLLRHPDDVRAMLKKVFVRVLLCSTVFFCLLYAAIPQGRDFFVREDGLLEYLSAAMWLTAFVVGGLAFCLKKVTRTPIMSAVIPLLGLMAFLDESSFMGLLAGSDNAYSSGSKVEKSPITLGDGYVIDGFHDFFTLPFKYALNNGVSKAHIAIAAVIFIVVPLVIFRKKYMPHVMNLCRNYEAFNYLRYAVIMVVTAMVLDMDIIPDHMGMFFEEYLEMLGGLTMCFAAISMLLELRKEK